MRRLRAALDATVGCRLLVRIWLHGVLLFASVIAIVMAARFVMSGQDAVLAARHHPAFTLGLTERALAMLDDDAALAAEVRTLHRETSIDLTVFAADDTLLATSMDPPPAAATPAERDAIAGASRYVRAPDDQDRVVVGAFRDGRLVGYAVAVVPAAPSVTLHLLALFATSLVIALVLVALPLTRSIVRPLERLRALSRALGDGDLAVRAPTERRDEIGDLARAFNRMAEQIQQLRAAERELLADVSHELRTPLARMRVVLELAADADPEPTQRYLREITTDLAELGHLLDGIITASRLDSPERWEAARPPLHRGPLDVGALAAAITARFRARWPGRALTCAAAEAPLVIDGDAALLRRVLDNLVDNARKYSSDDQPITVTVGRTELRGQPAARLEVKDEGIGIAPADQPRVFTAFFRADRSRTRATGGVGLGLALARRIVEAHDGTIGFTSDDGRGSRFWFVLPLADPR